MHYTTIIWIFFWHVFHKFFLYLINEVLILECLYWDRQFWCRFEITNKRGILINFWKKNQKFIRWGRLFGTQEYWFAKIGPCEDNSQSSLRTQAQRY